VKETLDQVLGVVIATIVAVILRWSARRWPLPGEDEGDDDPRPRRRRRSRRPLDDDTDPRPEED
jgi:hypothetical protein